MIVRSGTLDPDFVCSIPIPFGPVLGDTAFCVYVFGHRYTVIVFLVVDLYTYYYSGRCYGIT
jgi:hypothetical protein